MLPISSIGPAGLGRRSLCVLYRPGFLGQANEHRIVHTSDPFAKGCHIRGTYFAETAR